MSFVEPSFEIDTKGRVICQAHSLYPFFVMPGKTHHQEIQMEKLLTCKTCKHYQEDECFFPKSEIDKIEVDRTEKYSFEWEAIIEDAKEKFSKVDFRKNSVVIFDVDETALDNYGLAKEMGFGYLYELNKKWNAEMKAPAIKQVKDLYDFLLSKGSKIIFLTGRNFPEYKVT